MLYPVFVTSIAALQQHAALAAAAALGAGQRAWMAYPGVDPGSVPGTAAGLARADIATGYAEALAGGGSAGTIAADKLQSDYVAAQERAAHLQQSGPVRCRLHAAARRAAHGNAANGVFARVASHAQDLLVAGGGG